MKPEENVQILELKKSPDGAFKVVHAPINCRDDFWYMDDLHDYKEIRGKVQMHGHLRTVNVLVDDSWSDGPVYYVRAHEVHES